MKREKYEEIFLSPEGSDRKYTRVKTAGGTFILAESSPEVQKLFSKRLKEFFRAGLNVPGLKSGAGKKKFLLLEDLGDHSLEKKVLKSEHFPRSCYLSALDQIIKLQASRFSDLSVFGAEKFFKEMKWSEKYLIHRFFELYPAGARQKNYLREWKNICRRLASFPLKPAHRDYHSRNLFFKNKKIYLIDFQDAGLFPRFYDPVSLLYDAYVKISARERNKLFTYFISQSGFSGEELKNLKEEIRLNAVQRLFKALGSFAGFYFIKNQKKPSALYPPRLKSFGKTFGRTKNLSLFFIFGKKFEDPGAGK